MWKSLVVQWLRIHLPVKGIRVRSLVQEDPTCHGATKPVCHNCLCPRARKPQLLSPCATTTEPVRPSTRVPQLLSLRAATSDARACRAHAPQQEATSMRSPRTATKSSPRSLQLEKARAQQRRSNTAKTFKK